MHVKVRHLFASLLAVTASSAMATVTNFEFQARFTQIPSSSSLGGLKIGDYITGSFGYDTQTSASPATNFWSSTYSIGSNGGYLKINLSATSQLNFTTDLTAKVSDGPVYAALDQDDFSIETPYYNIADFATGKVTSAVQVRLNASATSNPITSLDLPSVLDLQQMPNSGAYLQVFSGDLQTDNIVYYQARFSSDPTYPTQSYINYYDRSTKSQGSFLADPGASLNPYQWNDPKYLSWVASGKPTSYIDYMAFHFTKITATSSIAPSQITTSVPEPETLALGLIGLIVLVAAQAAKQRGTSA